VRAAVVGIRGIAPSESERALFARLPPAGVILFRRNLDGPETLAALVAELRALLPEALLFVDQEGGRVQRLGPPLAPALPPPGLLGELHARDPAAALEAAGLHAAAIAATVVAAGLDVTCAPVLDVATTETTDAIGDRALADDPATVARLGRLVVRTLALFGVGAVVKHFPGHGRATADSHRTLPVVAAERDALTARDLVPFRACRDAPFAMTAHVLYPALDPERPASLSPAAHRLLREEVGFRGVVLSDDLAMGALTGPPEVRVRAARAAGCDLVLWCDGDPVATRAVLEAAGEADARVVRRLARLRAGLTRRRRPLPAAAMAAELARRLAPHHG